MDRFSDEAWRSIAGLRDAIHRHPFIAELAAGTLSRARFQGYITQDALYLAQFARALAIAAAKAPDAATLEAFANWALGAVAVEQQLHGRYLAEFGVDPAAVAAVGLAPDCLAYTSFLIATAYHEPWEVAIAALLPCFWIYWDVGSAIARQAPAENPYGAWIETYAGEGFGAAVRAITAIVDTAAAPVTPLLRSRMLAGFSRAAQYEFLFWDGAYRRRGWPPLA